MAVAYPRSTEEVSQIAKICHKYRMPMIPYSGGSSLEANFSAPHGGMSVDFAFMDKIVAMHEDDMDIVVQPSMQWMQLNDEIKDYGLFFPVDPGPSARIGGMPTRNFFVVLASLAASCRFLSVILSTCPYILTYW